MFNFFLGVVPTEALLQKDPHWTGRPFVTAFLVSYKRVHMKIDVNLGSKKQNLCAVVFDVHIKSLYFPLRPAEDALHLSVGADREESGLHTAAAAATNEGRSPFILGSGAGPI